MYQFDFLHKIITYSMQASVWFFEFMKLEKLSWNRKIIVISFYPYLVQYDFQFLFGYMVSLPHEVIKHDLSCYPFEKNCSHKSVWCIIFQAWSRQSASKDLFYAKIFYLYLWNSIFGPQVNTWGPVIPWILFLCFTHPL